MVKMKWQRECQWVVKRIKKRNYNKTQICSKLSQQKKERKKNEKQCWDERDTNGELMFYFIWKNKNKNKRKRKKKA